jgi:hypothetical protein
MNKLRSIVVLLIVLAALPTASLAEDAKSTLTSVAKALGSENLKTLHYSGAGSSYAVTQDPVPAGWPHKVMKSYVRDLNFKTTMSRLQLTRTDGGADGEETVTHAVDADSPWDSQYEFWITPYGFLHGAMAHSPTVESKMILGAAYKVVTFMLPGNHKVVGYINDKDLIEKVETWIGDRHVEALYRDYRDFNGVKVPMMITQKHAGHLSLILMVRDVKVEP